jgi:signal transduction histidine kinase/DNA-binding response OmpR family regulator
MAPERPSEIEALLALARRLAETPATAEAGRELARLTEALASRWRHLAGEARSSLEQLGHAGRLAEIGLMAGSIFHEMNQPLLGIKGFSELLAEQLGKGDPAKLAGWAQEVRRQVQRVHDMQMQVVSFLRKEPPNRQPVALEAALEEALGLFRQRMDKQHVQLSTAFQPGLPPALVCRRHLVQILVNLLANALDAMAGAPVKAIRVAAVQDPERDTLTVVFTDSGAGLPAEAATRLFEPFFSTKGDQGTGLGLFISRKLAQANGGDLRLGEPAELGWQITPATAFELSLPTVAPPERAAPPPGQPSPPPRTEVASSSDAARPKLVPQGARTEPRLGPKEALEHHLRELFAGVVVSQRVLLVDERPEETGGLLDLLSHHGMLADLAPSGEEALERLAARDYALLISSPGLPGMSGLELLSQARQSWPRLQRMLHGDPQRLAELQAALEANGHDFLARPVSNPVYANLRVQWALAAHGEEARAAAVVERLTLNCEALARARTDTPARACLAPARELLAEFLERAEEHPTVMLAPPQLGRQAEKHLRPVSMARTPGEVEDRVRAGGVFMVIAADGEGGLDGVALVRRLRNLDRRLAFLLVLQETRLEVLVQALVGVSAEILVRPMEGRELFVPRLRRLVDRHALMLRYHRLLGELEARNLQLLMGQ